VATFPKPFQGAEGCRCREWVGYMLHKILALMCSISAEGTPEEGQRRQAWVDESSYIGGVVLRVVMLSYGSLRDLSTEAFSLDNG
jgi:hypothetical protein